MPGQWALLSLTAGSGEPDCGFNSGLCEPDCGFNRRSRRSCGLLKATSHGTVLFWRSVCLFVCRFVCLSRLRFCWRLRHASRWQMRFVPSPPAFLLVPKKLLPRPRCSCWDIFSPSWLSVGDLGSNLDPSWAFTAILALSWGVLRPSWLQVGRSWGDLGSNLGGSWGVSWRFLVPC